MTVYTLTIDGKDVAGNEGQTIMEVAEENGIDIPGLCHLDGIHDRGAARPPAGTGLAPELGDSGYRDRADHGRIP